jgi:hypothetical protein
MTSSFVVEKTEKFGGFKRVTKFQRQLFTSNFSKATIRKHFSIVPHLGAISVGDLLILFNQERRRIIFRTATINID